METLKNINENEITNIIKFINKHLKIKFDDDVDMIIKDLRDADLVSQNKSLGRNGKTSHVAITTKSMDFFKNYIEFSRDVWVNLEASVIPKIISNHSTTYSFEETSISVAKDFSKDQLKVGKHKTDGNEFIELRKKIFLGDVIVFIHWKEKFYVLAFKENYWKSNIEISRGVYYGYNPNAETVEEFIEDEIYVIQSLDSSSTILSKEELDERDNRIPKILTENGRSTYKRDAQIGKTYAENEGYTCEYDKSHKTFISRATGKNYVEIHHLIPMKFQKNNPGYNLDRSKNLVCLCPVCHRQIHCGTVDEKIKIMKRIYSSREKQFNELFEEFGIKHYKELI